MAVGIGLPFAVFGLVFGLSEGLVFLGMMAIVGALTFVVGWSWTRVMLLKINPPEKMTMFTRIKIWGLRIIAFPMMIICWPLMYVGEALERWKQKRRLKKRLKKRERKMTSVNEMKFAVLGPSGAGKTTLLACMSEEFERVSPGIIFPADSSTFASLNKAYRSLKREADNPERYFERSIEGTSMLREFLFHIVGKGAYLPVRFYDFPGGWIIPGDSNNRIVIDIVKGSAVIIVAINTPYLMEFDGKYIDEGCAVDEIEWVLRRGLEGDSNERLILFVPIKCEKYLATPEERDNLHKAVKKAFQNTLMLTANPLYRDRLAIALLPVKTVGNAEFRRFKLSKDGGVEREVYRKTDIHSSFSPVNVDQPMRYMMSFLLEQFARNKKNGSWYDKFLSFIFREGDLKEVAEYIRRDIKSDNDLSAGFEIFCGRDLIGFPSHS